MKMKQLQTISADSTSAGDEEFSSFVNKAALEGDDEEIPARKNRKLFWQKHFLLPEQVLLLAVTELPTLVR